MVKSVRSSEQSSTSLFKGHAGMKAGEVGLNCRNCCCQSFLYRIFNYRLYYDYECRRILDGGTYSWTLSCKEFYRSI